MNTKSVLAIVAAVFFTCSAYAFEDFTIDEGVIPDAVDRTVVGDKFNGGYTEVLTINPDLSFDTVAYVTFSALFKDDGAVLASTQLGPDDINLNQYLLYAVFSASGVANPVTGIFTANVGSFSLYADPDSDTTGTLPGTGAGAVSLGNDSDDFLLATASSVVSLVGQTSPVPAFDFVWNDFTLTDVGGDQDGVGFFVSPNPFYFVVNVDGDFEDLDVVPGTIDGLTGDVSAVFRTVPEPATLALFAIGLLGLAATARRRKL